MSAPDPATLESLKWVCASSLRNTTAPSWRRCRTRDVSRLRHELSSDTSPTCLRNSSTKQPGLRTSPGMIQALIVDWMGVPKRDPGPLVCPWSSLKLFQRGYRPPVSPTKPHTDPLRHFLRPQRLAHLDRLNMTSSLSHKCGSSDSLRGYRLWVDPLHLLNVQRDGRQKWQERHREKKEHVAVDHDALLHAVQEKSSPRLSAPRYNG